MNLIFVAELFAPPRADLIADTDYADDTPTALQNVGLEHGVAVARS